MSELVEWLTKILDEDSDPSETPHSAGCNSMGGGWEALGLRECDCGIPVQWLADIAAKRAIIAEYVARDNDADLMLGPDSPRQREWSGLRLAVQIMATAYAERSGYRDEWKPLSSRTHP